MNNRLGWCAVLVTAAVVFCSFLFSPPKAHATDSRVFAGSSTAWGATNAWFVIPAVGDKVPVVKYLQVASDLTAARITFFSNSAPAIAYADSSGTNIQVTSGTGYGGTNGFAAGDIIVVRHGNTPTDTYERLRVHAVSTTNITVTTSLGATIAAGEPFWRQGTNAVICGCTNSATGLLGTFIQAGIARGQPVLVDINGSSTAIINAIGGEFQ